MGTSLDLEYVWVEVGLAVEKEVVLIEDLRKILEKAREEYSDLSDLDLLETNKDELHNYFNHSEVMKGLINSIEAYLDESKMSK